MNFDQDRMFQANVDLDALEKNQVEMKSPKMGQYKFQPDKTAIFDKTAL